MVRIRLSDASDGDPCYEFAYNPVEIYCPTAMLGEIANSVETMDGESVTFYPYHDSRRGKLVWRGYPADTSVLGVAFGTMITTLNGYVGNYKYMNFGDIASAYNVYTGWTKVKIIAIDKALRSGGGTIYDLVEMIWEDAEV